MSSTLKKAHSPPIIFAHFWELTVPSLLEVPAVVKKIYQESLTKINEDSSVGHGTRGGAPEFLTNAQPFFETFTTNDNKVLLQDGQNIFEKVLDTYALKNVEDKTENFEKVNEKFIDNKLNFDKLEAASRLDHIIIHGHKDPNQNYQINGYETQEQLEIYIIEAAVKVEIEIKPEHISFAHRIGQRPRNSQGEPRLREDSQRFCYPVLFKFVKRAKNEALMRQKKI